MSSELYKVIECFERISKTTKLREKKELLKQYDCKLLRVCLRFCYDPFLQFNVKQIPEDEQILKRAKLNLKLFFSYLKSLSQKGSATYEDRVRLSLLMGNDSKVRYWLKRIVQKDLGIGININIINDVFPNLIPQFNIMLAQPQSQLEKFLQTFSQYYINYKLDGIRCLAICKPNGHIILYSRNGRRLTNFTSLEKVLADETKELTQKFGAIVLDGELTDREWRNFQDLMTAIRRKYGSGRINYDEVVFNVFDIFSVDNDKLTKLPLYKRVELINDSFSHYPTLLEQKPEMIVRMDYELSDCNHIEYIYKKLNESLQMEFEGLILKNPNTEYKFKRTIDWVKVKKFDTVDCLVVDVFEGKGKYKDCLGGVIVQLPNGELCKVGSGFSDSERKYYWENPNDIIGKYIEVQYQGWTKDGRLRFPVFVRIRDDK